MDDVEYHDRVAALLRARTSALDHARAPVMPGQARKGIPGSHLSTCKKCELLALLDEADRRAWEARTRG